MCLILVKLITVIFTPLGAHCGGDGAVEEILPVWND